MELIDSRSSTMPTSTWKQRLIPLGLGVAMLGTLVAAALSPNVGLVQAQATSQYGTPAGTSSPFPWWIVGVIIAIVAALILAYLIVGRRRRPPQGRAPRGGPAVPPSGAATGAPVPPGPSHPYIESPEDVGAAMPAVGMGAAAGAGAGAGAAAAGGAEEEPDIDALMAELDKISGEILKKPPKGGSGATTDAGTGQTTQK
ncbi:MAG TPA: hypothetical protein VMI55_04885 [Thermoplasmata archaeon]|nr:hypothetical protein [Thermoplasmata archaeon]